MVIPIHKGDFQKLTGEGQIMASMRDQGVRPGMYMFPCASSMQEMGTPEHMEKMNQGRVGYLTVVPNGPMAMGKALGQWFVYSILIAEFLGYLTS